MFGNNGYINQSRSVRSESAIEDNIMPLSIINKDIIEELFESYNIANIKIPVGKFKEYVKCYADNEWHHTSKYFNETTHYDINSIFRDKTKEEIEDIINEINKIQIEKKEKIVKSNNFFIVELIENVWEGTKKHPKLVYKNHICYIL